MKKNFNLFPILVLLIMAHEVTHSQVRRLNTSSAVSLKSDFAALRQGDYSTVSLQLPGSSKKTDYYVKKWGTRLILDGDIIVCDLALQSTMSYTRDDQNHTFGKDDLYRWPGGIVPVVLDNSVFDTDSYNTIKSALDFFNFNTGIIFKERTNEQDYLVITVAKTDGDGSGRGGGSMVGRQRNGSNILDLVKGRFGEGAVMHELMHALGVFHEQARPDRDNYISILWSNINEAAKYNFQIEDNGTVRSAYDYCSIMHYPSDGFTINAGQATITCKNNGAVTACPSCMGSLTTLSKMDLDGLDAFYRGIGISRFPSKIPFVSARVPIAGCIGVADDQIKAKWSYYKNALGDCQTGVIGMGIFNTTYVQFEHGIIYHSPHGIFAVYGDIYQLFKAQNGVGQFGFPLTDEEDIKDAGKNLFLSWNKNGYTRVSKFEKGVIIWGAVKKAVALTNEKFTEGPGNTATQGIPEKKQDFPAPAQKAMLKPKANDSLLLKKH